MAEKFIEMLAVGGKSNSLGLVDTVIGVVLRDHSRLDELYNCLFASDAWVRMRAADALEKICRQHPDWLAPYIDRTFAELMNSTQPSIQWHLAQIYSQVDLSSKQKAAVIAWLKQLLSTKDADWIVAANAMSALMKFTDEGTFSPQEMATLLKIQQHHKSNAVIRRATKFLAKLPRGNND